MPITQDRMISLINAGRDYQQAFEAIRAAVEIHFQSANDGEESWQAALHAVWSHTKPATLLNSLNSPVILAVEYQHFKSFRGRNNRAAKSARKYRNTLVAAMAQQTEQTLAFPNITGTAQSTSGLRNQNNLHIPKPPKAKKSPTVIVAHKNTDAQQVQSDSDLFPEETPEHIPAKPSLESQAKILRDLAELEAKQQYEAEYNRPANQSGETNGK